MKSTIQGILEGAGQNYWRRFPVPSGLDESSRASTCQSQTWDFHGAFRSAYIDSHRQHRPDGPSMLAGSRDGM